MSSGFVKVGAEHREGGWMGEQRSVTDLPEIEGYAIEREIARGGMGVVYKAVQVRTGRPVAIKMILGAGRPGPVETLRFRLEAEAVASLDHPNIVQLLHPGEVLGVPYHVLEYVGGGTLEQRRDSLPAAPRAAAGQIKTLADAMGHAHGRGVVHRDLKPANVLLTDEAVPRSKIGDFGLARVLGGERSGLSQSRTFGTLEYMSPEQAMGGSSLREIGPETDVWALGVMLYEQLVGRSPFGGKTTLEFLGLICHAEPDRPRKLRPEIPRDLETICLKCLEKDPHRRYATARELADDLGRFLRNEPVTALPSGRAKRAWKWCQRHPAAAALVATGVAAAGLAVAGRLEHDRRQTAEARAREAQARAEGAEVKAQAARAMADVRRRQTEEIAYANAINLAVRELTAGRPTQADRLLASCPPALRGWEWHYLRRRLHSELVRIQVAPYLSGLGGASLPGLRFAPDGKRLILALRRSVALPGPEGTGPGLIELKPPLERSGPGALSPDGTLAAYFRPGLNAIMLTRGGIREAEQLLFGHSRTVLGMSFSPDGRRLASVSEDGSIRVWRVEDGRQEARLDYAGAAKVHSGIPAFSPDGKAVAVVSWRVGPGSEDPRHELTIWDPPEARPRFAAVPIGRAIGSPPHVPREDWHILTFSPDAREVAVAAHDGTIRRVDAKTGRESGTLSGHAGTIGGLAYFPDGTRLASCGDDRTVRVWDLRPEGVPPVVMHAHVEAVEALAVSPDGRRIASTDGHELKVWDSSRLQGFQARRVGREDVHAVALSPDGELLARGGINAGGSVRLERARTGEPVASLRQPSIAIMAVAFRPDGRRIAVAAGNSVHLWDVSSRSLLRTFERHDDLVTDVAFSPRGDLVASAGRGRQGLGQLWLWDPETGRATIAGALRVPGEPHLVFRPDGDELMVLGNTPTVGAEARAIDPHAGRILREKADVLKLAFSKQRVLSAWAIQRSRDDGHVEVFDAAQGAIAATIPEPFTTFLAFGPNGRRLATVGKRNLLAATNAEADQITVWDPVSGREALALTGHGGYMVGAFFTPDGNRLLAAGADGTVYQWDGTPLPEPPAGRHDVRAPAARGAEVP